MKEGKTSLGMRAHFVVWLVILILVSVSISSSGCLNQQSQPTTITSDQLEIQNRYFFNYNGTSYLTGVIVNKAPQSLINTNLRAEGYVNDTVYERGSAGPDTGIKSVIGPNERSPFMIKMTPVVSQSANSTVAAQKAGLSYRIEPQIGRLSSATPYPLSTIHTKAVAFNQAINVSGELYNEGNENVSSSLVAAAFYQENGTVLGVFTGSPQGDLGPQKTAAFQIDVKTSAFPIKPARTEIYAYTLGN